METDAAAESESVIKKAHEEADAYWQASRDKLDNFMNQYKSLKQVLSFELEEKAENE